MKNKNQLHKSEGEILRKTKPCLVHLNVVDNKPPCSADMHQTVEEEQTISETIKTTLFQAVSLWWRKIQSSRRGQGQKSSMDIFCNGVCKRAPC